MAITATELKRLQREVETLKGKVARLERRQNGKRRAVARAHAAISPRRREVGDNARAVEILRQAGLLAELTPEEKAMAAEWRALPEARKREVMRTLETTHFNPPLSETVIEDRG
jgi:hypothetical protein